MAVIYELYESGSVDAIQTEDEASHNQEDGRTTLCYVRDNEERDSWLNPDVIVLHRALDALHLSTRFTKQASIWKAHRGNFAHYPIDPPKTGNKHRSGPVSAPPGLPLNFYRKAWFESLSKERQAALRPGPSIPLEVSPGIRRSAWRLI